MMIHLSKKRSSPTLHKGTLFRLAFVLVAAFIMVVWAASHAVAGQQEAFSKFLDTLRPQAKAAGISQTTFDKVFKGITPDPRVIALTKQQSEFVRPIWSYIDGALGASRLERGRQAAKQWSTTLSTIESRYGVPRGILLGIWGMETNFGGGTGSMSVIRSLATLAFLKYRDDFFRNELISALRILEEDHIDASDMRGSWAGAMGQTQFMPSSFLKYAVDGDGDGRRDIWTSVPDALASTAHYLVEKGWQPGKSWGFEVTAPQGYDFKRDRMSLNEWAALGFERADGNAMVKSGEAWLFAPGGAKGPLFLLTSNYDAIKEYNMSDAYALAVAHLGDRLLGADAIQGAWPRQETPLSKPQRVEAQKKLLSLKFYSGKTDGKFGSKTRLAVRQFQLSRGLVADGYLNGNVFQALRKAP
jgi:membrane-bound lytic murein transglycosylase B